jgi:hypothetical protein
LIDDLGEHSAKSEIGNVAIEQMKKGRTTNASPRTTAQIG